ncbi:MAG: asparagine synthase (glutamine-hydrolyzing) [Bacteroidales bacterium]|nr:asparagine synthase (glutamine-hydrolyzing) [Bacteroidales bacterium]
MCGINGIAYSDARRKIDARLLERMNDAIIHRGPDDYGYHTGDHIGMAFRRLSIIDLSSGHQPMTDATGRLTIVFNGEIYNYRELKAGLLEKGYNFRTTSDTEVILNLFLDEGKEGIKKLRGMFSFVIWDNSERKLVAARDRFGIKPFYYYLTGETFVFASEMKSITEVITTGLHLDHTAIESFFTYGYILGEYSIFKEIRKLPPSTVLELSLRDTRFYPEFTRYWSPTYVNPGTTDEQEIAQMVRESLSDSVQKHLVSDVPVGAFLSGGIDSSSVVALISQQGHSGLSTFSIGFKENKFNELPYARKIVDRYQTKHHELIVEPASASLLERIISNYDEPFGDSSAVPTYIVSNLASQHVKVVLSGDGGDELFGGYDTYKRIRQIRRFGFIPGIIRKPLFRSVSALLPSKLPGKRFTYFLSKDPDFCYAYFAHVYENEKKKFFSEEFYPLLKDHPVELDKELILRNSHAPDEMAKMMELDLLVYMTDDILTKVDRASMLTSIEVRVPFIDHIFAEKVMGISSSLKIKGEEGKYILKKALAGDLPPEVLSHKKQGFTIPFNDWFKDDLKEFVADQLSDTRLLEAYINKKYLDNISNASKAGSLITRIFPVIVFSMWLRKNKHLFSS